MMKAPILWLCLACSSAASAQEIMVTFPTRPPGANVSQEVPGAASPFQFIGSSDHPVAVKEINGAIYRFRFATADHEGELKVESGLLSQGKVWSPTIILQPTTAFARFVDLFRYPDAWSALLAVLVGGLGFGGYRWRQRKLMANLKPSGGTETFGSYLLLEQLGHGGYGIVYRAVPVNRLSPKYEVAIKRLRPFDVTTEEGKQAHDFFQREIRITKDLVHPNIVEVKDYGDVDGSNFIVMELVRGKVLRNLLPSGGFAPKQALHYLRGVSEGLAYAHSKGIIHRDLKPDNVMAAADGSVKLLDFGLARKEVQTFNLTGMAILGTLGYMAPEILSTDQPTVAVDIYAFGVLAFELLAGETPVPQSSLQTPEQIFAYMADTKDGKRRDLASIRPDLQDASLVIDRMLEVEPAKRYNSVRGAYEDLEKALRNK